MESMPAGASVSSTELTFGAQLSKKLNDGFNLLSLTASYYCFILS